MCGATQSSQQGKDAMDFENPLTFFPDGKTPITDKRTGGFDPEVKPLTISSIPPGGLMGFSEDQLYRRKALQDIINDPGTDKGTLRNAQRQWILMQRGGA